MGARRKRKASASDLAAQTGYSERTVRDYLARGWDGDPATLEAWRGGNLRKRGSSGLAPRMDRRMTGEGGAAVAESEGRTGPDWAEEYRRVKTMSALLALKVQQGEFVARAEVDRLFAQRVAEVRAGLLGLPRALARRLAHQDAAYVEQEIEAEVLALLERYSRGDPILEGKAPRKRGKRTRTG